MNGEEVVLKDIKSFEMAVSDVIAQYQNSRPNKHQATPYKTTL